MVFLDRSIPVDASSVQVAEFARLDVDRRRRTGIPEVVFAAGKTVSQTVRLLEELRASDPDSPALATRCDEQVRQAARDHFEEVWIDDTARTVVVGELPATRGDVVVVTAGTSDIPVARECIVTLLTLGVHATLLADVGVAGLGRLLAHVEQLREADCIAVVAGMDGALPSVVAGLVAAPVVAVPTSVGYGVAAGGLAAAACMLSSCSPGLAVVNIDNGFGAAVHLAKIMRAAARGH